MTHNLSFHYSAGTHQEYYADMLYKSIHGTNAVLPKSESNETNVVCWGWRKGKQFRDAGKNVLVMERGYLSDRKEWTSLSYNGLNGYANFYNENVPDDRWTKYWKSGMKEWVGDRSENYILVCGQVPTDASLFDCHSYTAFLITQFDKLYSKYGKRVAYRPHPLAVGRKRILMKIPRFVEVIDPQTSTLEQNLANTRMVVAWNSNSLVEAMYNGIPFQSNSPGSMVHKYQMNDPFDEPDRNDWGRKISYCQWNKEELLNGTAWKHIQAGL